MKRKRNFFVNLTAIAVFTGILSGGESVLGQIQLQRILGRGIRGANAANVKDAGGMPADDVVNNVFLAPDRATLQLLSQAKELLNKGRYSEGVRNLGAILDGREDYFFQPTKDRAIHRSLRAEAQRLIGEMPKEGRDTYEAIFGDRARAMLNTAVGDGDIEVIAEVARRFFHTKAGYEATFLLGLYNLDHAHPLAAALSLQRIKEISYLDHQFEPTLSLALASSWMQAGSPEKAKEILIEFKNRNLNRQLVIGGKNVPLFKENAAALEWLVARVGPISPQGTVETDRWVMFRGNPQRNASSPGSAPLLNLRWEVPSAADPAIEEALQIYYRMKADADQPFLPSSHPLVVDDLVLMRTCSNLLALDFNTGKRLWEVPVEEPAENNASIGGDLNLPLAVPQNFAALNPASMQGVLAVGRASDDSLFGTLSSDGRLVYSIEDAWSNGLSARAIALNGRQMNASGGAAVFNYLAARDIHSGKLKWAIGGPNDQFALPQAETFFLGPPLPLLGQLYVIGEVKGEIRLFVLDPDPEKKRDRVVWSQQLAVVEHSIQEDPLRRITCVSPSYADGILVCPTSTGAIVAVDLATRSLLWGYRYGTETRNNYPNFLGRQVMLNSYGAETSRWADSSVSIASGRVLITSVDSDALFCLNLSDGDPRWKVSRQDDLYVACVYQGNVIMVGCKQVRAYRLEDGKAAWNGRIVDLPEGDLPSGRGFLGGDKYYLPLSSAEVAAIDLVKGKIERVSKSQKGDIPGNLVCYKGRILSQNYRGLEVFYQLDAASAEVAARLAANPRDAEALCLRGEILLDAGDRTAAVECYRKAYEIAADPRTKLLLRDSLLDGLRMEFAVYRSRESEIEKLLENSTERAAYLRLMIAGLQKEGELKAAFNKCQLLIDLDPGRFPLESVSKSLLVRRDRWIQARLDTLRSLATPEFAAQMDAAISARFAAARVDGSIDGLKTFLGVFGNQPPASNARAELIEKFKQNGRALDVELAIWQSQPALSRLIGGPALAEAADFFRQNGQTEAAAASYRWLLSRFSDTVCRDGNTARRLVEAIPPNDPLRSAVERRDPWPVGKVDALEDRAGNNGNRNNYGHIPLEFRGNRGPYFEDRNLVLAFEPNQNRLMLRCTDASNNEIWQFPLNDANQLHNQVFASNREGAQVRAWGHVLLLPLGGRLLAIDTLGADETNPPKILWSEEGGDTRAELPATPRFRGAINLNGAVMRMGMLQLGMNYSPFPSGEANFIANRCLCVQRNRTLRALNPLDGQTLWQREGIPLASTIFGDDELVFVLPPDKLEASVYRALDGELLGTRKIERRKIAAQHPDGAQFARYVPLTSECLAAFGRNLLFWRQNGDRRTLELFDVWRQKSIWPARDFSSKARFDLVNREVLGIVESTGKFTLISLPDGRTLAETQLEPDDNLSDVTVIPYEDSYLILTNSPARPPLTSIQSNPMIGAGDKPVMRGRLYAIDRQGKLLWPAPAKITNQHLVSGQAQGFPALVFASQIYEVQPNRPGKIRVAVQLIDKRTGHVVYEKQDLPQSGYFKVTADPQKKTMQIALQRNTVTLTFTDKPWPTKEELEKIEAERKKNAPPKSLFKALKNAAEDMFKFPETEDPFE